MNRRPTDEQLGNMLKTPHFGNGGALPASDPITPTPMGRCRRLESRAFFTA